MSWQICKYVESLYVVVGRVRSLFQNSLHTFIRFFLCAYVFSITCSLSGMEVFAWALVSIVLIYGLYEKMQGRKWPIQNLGGDYWFWGFWALMIFGAFWHEGLSHEERTLILGEGRWVLALYFLVWALERNSNFVEKWLWMMIPVLFLVSLYSITQAFSGLDWLREEPYAPQGSTFLGWTHWRTKGFFSMTLTYSYLYGMILCFLLSALTLYPFKTRWHFLGVGLSSLLVGLSLIMTLTRGLYVALPLTLVLMALLTGQKVIYKTVLILFIVSGVTVAFFPMVQLRITSIWDMKDISIQQRLATWKANIEVIRQNPLLGVGYGMNQERAQEFYMKPQGTDVFKSHAHNNILEILSGMGVIGFIFYVGFMSYFMFMAFKLYRESESPFWKVIGLGSFGAQWIFHLGGMTEATFVDAETIHMLVLTAALTLVGYKKYRRDATVHQH